MAALARDAATGARPIVHNPVLLLLALFALPAAFGLAFVSVAPNRLVSGLGLALVEIMNPERMALPTTASAAVVLPATLLVLAAFMPGSRWLHAAVAIAAARCWRA